MIPILYDRYETAFASGGLGRLSDCISCIVTEERNGIYECEFVYPITGTHYDMIEHGSIVYVPHDDTGDTQPFVIYSHSAPIDGQVTFFAHHISYRLNNIVVEPFTAGSCAAALLGVGTHSVTENPFTFWTDKETTGDFELTTPKEARAILGGEENSILDVYGKGDYEWDHFDVKLHSERGQNAGVEIRYGKNLVDLTEDVDSSGLFDAVVPFWTGTQESEAEGEDEEVLIMLPEKFVAYGDSSAVYDLLATENLEIVQNQNDVDIYVDGVEIRTVSLDLTDKFDEAPTAEDLRAAAAAYLQSAQGWVPVKSIEVDFVQLWQTEEYAEYAPLQRVRLCDLVSVYYPAMKVFAVQQKVVRTVYNVLLDRYDSITLGELQTTLGQEIRDSIDFDLSGVAKESDVLRVVSQLNAMAASLEAQIDLKIQTWRQATDPQLEWTAEEKASHDGDLWCYTGATTATYVNLGTYRYSYNSSTGVGTWSTYDATEELFDAVDGKTTIYYGSPSGTYSGVETGDYLVDPTDGCSYRWDGSGWIKVTDYNSEIAALRTSLESQIDAKIETWAQASNPASSWTAADRAEHDGDLWLYTGTTDITVGSITVHPQGVYKYTASSNAWVAYASTSDNLFDLADGKTTIFYGTTSGTYANKEIGDYLVDSTDGCTYRWTGSEWTKVTDYNAAIEALKLELQTQIDGKVETWAQSSNPAASWTTTALRTAHNGDLWLYTGLTDLTVGSVTIHPQGVYKYNGSTGVWAVYSSTTNNLFDLADRKMTIFYGTTSGTYSNKEVGDYLVDSTDGSTYRWSGTAWVKVTDYASAISSMRSTLETAITSATQKITGAQGGYVYLKPNSSGYPEEILIMNTQDYSTATKIWRWNLNGLGYSSNGYSGTFGTAITMDGKIVADYITAGTLNANIIKAGVLQDTNGNTSFDLSTGTLTIKKGSINLGNGNFTVNNNGTVVAKLITLGNRFTANANGLVSNNGVIDMQDNSQGSGKGSELSYSGLSTWANSGAASSDYVTIDGEESNFNEMLTVSKSGVYVGGNDAGDTIGFGSDGTYPLFFPDSGSLTAAPNLRYASSNNRLRYTTWTPSSRQLKKNITTEFRDELDPTRLYDIDVVQYDYNEEYHKKFHIDPEDTRYRKTHTGIIIEDLDKIWPLAVDKDDKDDPTTWTRNDAHLIPPMLKLIQSQHEEIEELRAKLVAIASRIAALETKGGKHGD